MNSYKIKYTFGELKKEQKPFEVEILSDKNISLKDQQYLSDKLAIALDDLGLLPDISFIIKF